MRGLGTVRRFLQSEKQELLVRRYMAFLIDCVTVGIIGVLIRLLLRSAPGISVEVLVATAAEATTLMRFDGWTPGRAIFRLRILPRCLDGTHVLVRTAGRWWPVYAAGAAVTFGASEPFGGLTAVLVLAWYASALREQGQTSLHDTLAHTHVEWQRRQ